MRNEKTRRPDKLPATSTGRPGGMATGRRAWTSLNGKVAANGTASKSAAPPPSSSSSTMMRLVTGTAGDGASSARPVPFLLSPITFCMDKSIDILWGKKAPLRTAGQDIRLRQPDHTTPAPRHHRAGNSRAPCSSNKEAITQLYTRSVNAASTQRIRSARTAP
jgi:hypothetical protein